MGGIRDGSVDAQKCKRGESKVRKEKRLSNEEIQRPKRGEEKRIGVGARRARRTEWHNLSEDSEKAYSS